jgi:hypothetical protein
LRPAGFSGNSHDGATEKFQSDPFWRDNIYFFGYFHGDNGAGLAASQQIGWTGLVAKLIELYGFLDPKSKQSFRSARISAPTQQSRYTLGSPNMPILAQNPSSADNGSPRALRSNKSTLRIPILQWGVLPFSAFQHVVVGPHCRRRQAHQDGHELV